MDETGAHYTEWSKPERQTWVLNADYFLQMPIDLRVEEAKIYHWFNKTELKYYSLVKISYN